MAEVNIQINGRYYGIACDDGQERRVTELARQVDSRVRDIARAGAASSESHLLVLASILMADEMADLRDNGAQAEAPPISAGLPEEDEEAIVNAIDGLASRIDEIAGNLQRVG